MKNCGPASSAAAASRRRALVGSGPPARFSKSTRRRLPADTLDRMSQPFKAAVLLIAAIAPGSAQGNYEVQVYGAELTPKGVTMVEMHSNFTAKGSPGGNGVLPTHHAEHETLEITYGFNEWFECGFYQFTA